MPGMPGMEGEKKGEVTIGNEASTSRTFLLDGVKASFSIMNMAEHKKMLKDMKMNLEVDPQATHNIAVTPHRYADEPSLNRCCGQDESNRPEGENPDQTAGLHAGHEPVCRGFYSPRERQIPNPDPFQSGHQKTGCGILLRNEVMATSRLHLPLLGPYGLSELGWPLNPSIRNLQFKKTTNSWPSFPAIGSARRWGIKI